MSLDALAALGKDIGMILQPHQLYVERTDSAKNMARRYTMEIKLKQKRVRGYLPTSVR